MLDLRHLADLTVDLGSPLELGDSPCGRRRIIPIMGGKVTGDRLEGCVLDGGADRQTVFAGGSAELDTRSMIETIDGALIDLRNFGYRHGSPDILEALARGEVVDPAGTSRFETGDPRYTWLNRLVAVGTGERLKDAVKFTLYEVL